MSRFACAAVSLALAACTSAGDDDPPARAATVDAAGAVGSGTAAASGGGDEINPRLLRRFRAVVGAKQVPTTPEQVALGRMLFFDPRLSLHDDISCNSCHALDRYGVDHLRTSVGSEGQHGNRNAPTVFNASTHIAQFWDGRAATIEDQAHGPILNSREMGMPDEPAVLARLAASPEYAAAFRAAFPEDPDPIAMNRVGDAIGAFERGLVTTSRWDAFVAGDEKALTAAERHGLKLFMEVGCMGCHTGPQVGGTMFQHVGVMEPWPNQTDPGRAGVTQDSADRMVFKVPSLKNIAQTAPYFHDGSVTDLHDAVKMMGRYQLGVDLSAPEIDAIVTWMGSMTGRVDPAYIAPPKLPGR